MNNVGETVTRRGLLLGGLVAAGGTAIVASGALAQTAHEGHDVAAAPAAAPIADPYATPTAHGGAHGDMMTVGEVDYAANGFDPSALLTDWETGTVSTLPDGRTLRSFEIQAIDREIEIAPGVMFPAWTYNGHSSA